ncbi:MAG: redoxin domain-containing protein [Bacteroidales bacterium]|nr:redoxin domain-containing protein [Bacteroidales bacterium]MCF8388010.1 redoxin domain-containing protein [Bacteroidales bacterium]MCF8398855.1 redoxin domain-containing protein [Bacteroidales bacterium]
MKKLIVLIFILVLVLPSCKDKPSGNTAIVKGELNHVRKNKLFLVELDIKRIRDVDSVVLKNGRFELEVPLEEASIFLLKDGEVHYLPLIIKPGDVIGISGDSFGDPASLTITGSNPSAMLKDYEERFQQNRSFVDSLVLLLRKAENQEALLKKRDETQPLYDSVAEDQARFAKSIVEKSPGSLAALFLLNQRFGQKNLFDSEKDLAYFKMIDSGLMANIPRNKHSIDHHIRMESLEKKRKADREAAIRLATGKKAPELSLPDTSGNPISLQSLRGKYTLLYFWAAMDVFSRKANADMKKFYKQHKNKDFEIYAISLDKTPSMWKHAIRMDTLKWVNVADIGGMKTPTSRLFNVPDLNYMILLDPEGKIRYKGFDIKAVQDIIGAK